MTTVEKGSLFLNKKSKMFVVSEIYTSTYRGVKAEKVKYYPIGDSGLVCTTKSYTCNLDLLTSGQYKVLDWKF